MNKKLAIAVSLQIVKTAAVVTALVVAVKIAEKAIENSNS